MIDKPVTSFNRNLFASRLVNARKKSKLSRDEVVEKATTGFARSSLQEWEAGNREPKLEYIYDLANIYQIHPWDLLGDNMPLPSEEQKITPKQAIQILTEALQPDRTQITESEQQLITDYRNATDTGKQAILATAKSMAQLGTQEKNQDTEIKRLA